MKKFFLILGALALLSCSQKTESTVYHIDPDGDYPVFPFNISDLADVSYVKLGGEEKDFLFDFPLEVYIDEKAEKIIAAVTFQGARSIKAGVFDMQGNFLAPVGRWGRGPGEYNKRELSLMVSPEKEEITIFDGMRNQFLRYGYDGVYRASDHESYPFVYIQGRTALLNDKYVFFYQADKIKRGSSVITQSDKPPFQVVESGSLEPVATPKLSYSKPFDGRHGNIYTPMMVSENGIMLTSLRSDTTYMLSRDLRLVPVLVNAGHNGPDKVLYPVAESKDYLFCWHSDCAGERWRYKYFAIRKIDGEVFRVRKGPDGSLDDKPMFNLDNVSLTPRVCFHDVVPG